MYAEGVAEDKFTEGDVQELIGAMIPFFQDLLNFVVRIYDVVKNTVNQLASLYTDRRVIQFDPTGVHLQPIYEHLGDALSILVILDEMIGSNDHLLDHWKQYKMSVVTLPSLCEETGFLLTPFIAL